MYYETCFISVPADWGPATMRDPGNWSNIDMWIDIEHSGCPANKWIASADGFSRLGILSDSTGGTMQESFPLLADPRQWILNALANNDEAGVIVVLYPVNYNNSHSVFDISRVSLRINDRTGEPGGGDDQPVPEPATLMLIGTGIPTLLAFTRRKKVSSTEY
jgi:hypothetical protein